MRSTTPVLLLALGCSSARPVAPPPAAPVVAVEPPPSAPPPDAEAPVDATVASPAPPVSPDAQAPSNVVATPEPSPTTAEPPGTDHATEQTRAPTAAECRRMHADQPRLARCRWRGATHGYCGGARPSPDQENAAYPECVCDGCASDADCTQHAGGRCRLLESPDRGCVSQARVCVYASLACPSGGRQGTRRWRHDSAGHAVCQGALSPRP